MMKKYTKWKNEPTIDDLKRDFDEAKTSYNTHLDRLSTYKSVLLDNGKLANTSKSSYKSKLMRKQNEWVYPNLEEPILSETNMFSVEPLNMQSEENGKITASALNYQWNSLVDKQTIVNQAARKFAIEGTGVIKVGWELVTETTCKTVTQKVYAETDEQIEQALSVVKSRDIDLYNTLVQRINNGEKIPIGVKDVEVKDVKVKKNQPTYEVKSNESLMTDPSCRGIVDNMRFLIDIFETDYASIVKNKDMYFNLDKLKKHITEDQSDGTSELSMLTGIEEDIDFVFSDTARKKITMYEYWGFWDINDDGILEPIVGSWVGDILIRLQLNPFPHKKIPYAFGQFMPIENEVWGESNANLIKDDQDSLSTVVRAMQDITAENAVGQEFLDVSFLNPVQRENYKRGKTVYVEGLNPKDIIHRKSVEPVPKVLFDMFQMYSDNASKLTGIGDFDTYANSGSIQSAASVPINADADSNRDMGILRRFLSIFKKAGAMTAVMNREFLLSDTMIKNDGKMTEIGDVDALSGDYNVNIKIVTPKINNDRASKLLTLMQTNSANMSPTIAAKHYIKIADLWSMNDLSNSIEEEMKAGPSEEQMLLQQLELERLKLANKQAEIELYKTIKGMEVDDARIEELRERNSEEKMDAEIEKFRSQGVLAVAEAEKKVAQTKLFEQEFIDVDSGSKRQREKDDNEFQHLANLEREDKRTEREENNLKIRDNKDKTLDYIKKGTLENDSYDPIDDIYRNILEKNSV